MLFSKRFCDRCKEELLENNCLKHGGAGLLLSDKKTKTRGKFGIPGIGLDLCGKCYKSFKRWCRICYNRLMNQVMSGKTARDIK